MALGARKRDVVGVHMRDGTRPLLVGLPLGLLLAVAASSFVDAILFGVSALRLGNYVVVATALAGLAGVASYLPARWAAKADPVTALRAD